MNRKPRRSARDLFATTTLALEAVVVLFAGLVAYGLRLVTPAAIVVAGTTLALLCVLAVGLLRRHRAGYVLGWLVQGLLLAAGVLVPMMFAIGGVFTVLWLASLRIGAQLDIERVEREDAEDTYLAEHAG